MNLLASSYSWGSIIVSTIGTISAVNLVAVFTRLSHSLGKIGSNHKSEWLKYLYYGLIGGLLGIFCNMAGYSLDGATISIRDVGPMVAGYTAGPWAGLIAGVIAGVFRLCSGISAGITNGSTIPCSISTLLIGVLSGVIYKYFRPKKLREMWAMIFGILFEVLHLGLVAIYVGCMQGWAESWTLIKSICLPYLISNAVAFGIFVFVTRYIRKIEKKLAHDNANSTELKTATHIQSSLLPNITASFPNRKEFNLAAMMDPAKEIGGDFYDFFFVDDDHFAFLIADVSGKGIPAALYMVVAKTTLKNNILSCPSLKEAVEKTNNELLQGNDEHMFVTSWIGILEISTGKLTYVNAGHNPPVIKRGNKGFEYLRGKSGFILSGMEDMKYKELQTRLLPDDKIFIYTDGVTEAQNEKAELFGEERLLSLINSAPDSTTSKEIIEEIKEEIAKFRGSAEQSDDMTMVAVSMKGMTSYLNGAPTPEEFDKFSSFIEQKLSAGHVDAKNINAMQIVFDEIYSNIVKYSKATTCTMGISLLNDEITLDFRYDGVKFDITEAKEPDVNLASEERSVGGLGLYIVKKTMDKFVYLHDGQYNNVILKRKVK